MIILNPIPLLSAENPDSTINIDNQSKNTHSSHQPNDDSMLSESEEDEKELKQLLGIINKHTKIATNNRMNADYVPGMVTVYLAEELLARGAYDVGDVLDLVNGHHARLVFPESGPGSAPSQGLYFKWMINDTPIDTLTKGMVMSLTQILISQIERIEFIQGPGSQAHGNFAYAGLIHIITRQSGHHLIGSIGTAEHSEGSALISGSNDSGTLHMSLGLAGWRSGGPDRESNIFRIRQNMAKSANLTHVDSDPSYYKSALFSLKIAQNTKITANAFSLKDFVRGKVPSAAGNTVIEPGAQQLRTNIALHHSYGIEPDMALDFHIGYQRLQANFTVINPAFLQGNTTLPASKLLLSNSQKESDLTSGIDLTIDRWTNHSVFFGLQMAKSWITWDTFNPLITTPLSQNRIHWSLAAQDAFKLNKDTTLTTGIRYDRYDQGGSNHLSPRLALVHQLNANHLIKAQYAFSARPISRDEAYLDIVKPQTADTLELGYIYRSPRLLGRVTAFHAWHHTISGVAAGVDDDARLVGMEADLQYSPSNWYKLLSTLAWSVPEGDGVLDSGKASWFMDSGLDVLLKDDLRVNFRLDHYQKPSFQTSSTHFTGTWNKFLHPEFRLQFHVRNLLLLQNTGGPSLLKNVTDRQWRLDLTYRF
ncbi:MAG: TonB-dependent receptor [Magnetococcales bacterium]|nr:TonB-dependent receptor [Magnetococcales bacterium]